MREEKIIVRPFEDLRVLDYQGIKQINEHAQVEIKGEIPLGKKAEYAASAKNQIWVQVVAVSQEAEYKLFYGVIEQTQLAVKNGTCIMTLTLRSGTFLMDKQEQIRSFQKAELSYMDLLEVCSQDYENPAKIMTVGEGKSINQFIMQYRETDWDFIKRLASMNQTVVIADCSTKGEKYYFGIPDRKSSIEGSLDEYETQCDMQEYWYKKARGISITPQDTMSYVWESREIYELGNWGTIEGQQLYVWKIVTSMKGNELYHTYFMKPKSGFQMPVQYNPNISGISLLGRVKKVKEEKVQLELYADENKEKAGVCWFTFATVYSSPDGTGWYCMPEIEDQVRLYFPTNNEQEAYVASAYHEGGAKLRKNPKCKFWRNKEGKEIRLTPEKILLTNNEGTYIELSDEDGIVIVSDSTISIHAEESLNLSSANASIELSAPKKITLKQGDTEMKLGGSLDIKGSSILL